MRDGSSYNGEFRENKIDGIGIFIWPDKRHYTGQWVNNVMHGTGIMIWPDGRSYEGGYCILFMEATIKVKRKGKALILGVTEENT